MTIESEVLYALWALYQRNLISEEQKGMMKDMLIRKDDLFLCQISQCESQLILQHRILELLNDQESPRNSSCISPLKRMPSCSTTQSRQRFKSANNNNNQSKTFSKLRSSSVAAI